MSHDDVVQPVSMLTLSIIADSFIFLAYMAIPIEIFYFTKKYKLNVGKVIYVMILFISFIFFCGLTHAVNIYTFFFDTWVLLTILKIFTAIVSVLTAVSLIFVIPQVVETMEELEGTKLVLAKRMLRWVNHEIRGPLQSILGRIQHSQLLLQEEGSDCEIIKSEVNENLDTAMESGKVIIHIVNDVLDVDKLQQNKMKLENKEVNLDSFMDSFLKTIETFKEQNVHVDLQIEQEPNLVLICDSYRLNQILMNLITNAYKYTTSTIKIHIEKYQHCIIFSIIDNGCGIKNEKRHLIFQKFEASDGEDIARHNSVGLGLYLCKMLLDIMHGEINFITQPGKGTVFYFILPLNFNQPHYITPLVQTDFKGNIFIGKNFTSIKIE
jgi:signal transduction histidine kinase